MAQSQLYSYYHSPDEPTRGSDSKHHGHHGRQKPKRRWLRRLLLLLLLLVLAVVGYVGWTGLKLFANTPKVFGGTPFSNMTSLSQPTVLKGEDSGMVNVLITGNSVDDPGHGGADLTDSIMLMRVNPMTHKTVLVSIPRDLWVNIPGVGYRKINEAYHWGKEDGFSDPAYPAGGMGLLEKTVSETFDIKVHYYMLVNYSALKNLVDAVGGVDVTIASSDERGLYDPNIQASDGGPLKLANGPQHLNGQTALNLARARGSPAPSGERSYGYERGDFTRTENQRLLLAALQKQMLTTKTIVSPITMGRIFDALGNNVQTDMKINEAWRLASLLRAKDATTQSIGLSTPTNNLLRGYSTPSGQSALIPAAGISDYSSIIKYINSQ